MLEQIYTISRKTGSQSGKAIIGQSHLEFRNNSEQVFP